MKPYAPLGILYLCSHLRAKGFDVDVFDTTFSSRELLFERLRNEAPSVLGIYANLMTRGNAVEIIRVAREAGWRVVVGGPEPGAYALEYLQSGAEFVVFGEGESTMEELLAALCGNTDRYESGWRSQIAGVAYLDATGMLQQNPPQGTDSRSGCATVAGSPCDRSEALCGNLARPPRQGFGEFHHRARLPL